MSRGGPPLPSGEWSRRSLHVFALAAAPLILFPSTSLAASSLVQSREIIVSPTASVESLPDGLAIDAGTHSLYTVDQAGSISVLDTGQCNANAVQGCDTERVGTISLPPGSSPRGVAIDTGSDTIYVADTSLNEISVINGATCNATDRSGCTPTSSLLADPARAASSGPDPSGPASVRLNSATCQPQTSGCGQTVKTVHVGTFPDGIAVDQVTHTVYVTNRGSPGGRPGDTVSVIDGATCNGVKSSGCDRVATLDVGAGPGWIALDDGTHTAYTVNQAAGTVSVIDMATCDAVDTSGCGQKTATIAVGASPFVLTIDQELHTAYVASNLDDTVSVIDLDAATCAGAGTGGCRTVSSTARVSADASGVAVDTANRSVYVVNRGPGPGPGTVSVIDAATCNSRHRAGCARQAAAVRVGVDPAGVTIDQTTNTVYVANNGGATVSVIDAAHCNATDHAGCARSPSTITVGRNPFGIGVEHGQ
jgi:DNA-binding beta-propeller fold protein YncE